MQKCLRRDVGSSCAADREDPTSHKRAVVERDASKSYVGQAAIPPPEHTLDTAGAHGF